MAQKLLHYDVTQKNLQPQTKKSFFECRQEDVPNFEGLNSPLTQSGGELWRWQGNRKLLVLGWNPGTIYS